MAQDSFSKHPPESEIANLPQVDRLVVYRLVVLRKLLRDLLRRVDRHILDETAQNLIKIFPIDFSQNATPLLVLLEDLKLFGCYQAMVVLREKLSAHLNAIKKHPERRDEAMVLDFFEFEMTNYDVLFEQAYLAIEQQNFELAMDHAQDLLSFGPPDAGIYELLGHIYQGLAQKNPPQIDTGNKDSFRAYLHLAAKNFHLAVGLSPIPTAELYIDFADSLVHIGQAQKAKDYLNAAWTLENHLPNPRRFVLQATCSLELGELKEAQEFAHLALKYVDAIESKLIWQLREIFLELNDSNMAISCLEKIIERENQNPRANNAYLAGLYGEAAQEINIQTELAKAFVSSWN